MNTAPDLIVSTSLFLYKAVSYKRKIFVKLTSGDHVHAPVHRDDHPAAHPVRQGHRGPEHQQEPLNLI